MGGVEDGEVLREDLSSVLSDMEDAVAEKQCMQASPQQTKIDTFLTPLMPRETHTQYRWSGQQEQDWSRGWRQQQKRAARGERRFLSSDVTCSHSHQQHSRATAIRLAVAEGRAAVIGGRWRRAFQEQRALARRPQVGGRMMMCPPTAPP